jgi:glutaminyl-peptide cyclotransferase
MPSTQTSSPHEHYDEELVTEVIEETRTEDTQEDETSTDIQTPPTQKTPWFKTRLFLIIVVAAVVVTLFIFAVVLFGFVSKPTPVVKKPVVHRNTTNVPLQLIDDYTQDILGFGARVPGSVGSKKTKDFIAETLGENWRVEYDSFQAETPTLGSLNFSNIIATYQSPSSKRQQEPTRKRLIISAHYDSKYFAPDASGKIFVGATDSAVPCAMMLHLAEAYENMVANSTTAPHYDLQLVFFDGEEAVSYWSSTDSLCKYL